MLLQQQIYSVLTRLSQPTDCCQTQNITLSCRFNSCPVNRIVIDESGSRLALIAESSVSFFQRPDTSKKFNLTWIDTAFGTRKGRFSDDLNTILQSDDNLQLFQINWRKLRIVEMVSLFSKSDRKIKKNDILKMIKLIKQHQTMRIFIYSLQKYEGQVSGYIRGANYNASRFVAGDKLYQNFKWVS